ncbi:MAG: acetyl-CoA carboxylase biotin carboxylase subunit [Planctomycetota bacterium]
MFRKVLIANRGEIARRIIRACHKLGVEAVAAYSWADRDSPHLEEADQRVAIGGPRSSESYLNMEAILQAAIQTDCQGIHPGYGFLAENALFSRRCQQQGTTFIGPPSHVIELMGEKSAAKITMKRHGLPLIPGSEGTVRDLSEVRRIVNEIGYPVLFKATAGGGGKGMRLVRSPDKLEPSFQAATLEASKAFGDGSLYIEKYIEPGRHIEFQVLADAYGNVIHLGERECSLQRNHQKLLEESPSTVVDRRLREEMGRRVCEAVRRVGYRNAGTVEFLMGPDGQLYFIEMNTRLQVEHPVTEMVTGEDIVVHQLRIAANVPLELRQEDVAFSGHAIECRINAEDPLEEFKGSPGRITRFFPPPDEAGTVRLDTHVEPGYTIPPFYDSMIGKLIVKGEDRKAAIARMSRALERLAIEGVPTTIPLHREVMHAEAFVTGRYHTGTIPEIVRSLVAKVKES